MTNTAVIGSNVSGSISECKLNAEQSGVDRKGALSLTQTTTISLVNSCTGEVSSTYTVKELSGFSVISLIFIGIIILKSVWSYYSDRY